MKARHHRRVRFWMMFLLFSVLLLYVLERGMLSRLSAWIHAPSAPVSREIPIVPGAVALSPLDVFHFEDEAALSKWEQKVFKGKTRFEIKKEAGRPYLCSLSEDSSCGLYMKVSRPATPQLYLHWKWRARTFPHKREPLRLSNRSEDDFAARLYVIFQASNLFRSDVIEYVWDESLPAGRVEDSPYSDRIKLFVVRSGAPDAEGEGWREETRNPLEDYRKLFGKDPKNPIGILALMCDSDNTGTRAEADFEEILIGTKK